MKIFNLSVLMLLLVVSSLQAQVDSTKKESLKDAFSFNLRYTCDMTGIFSKEKEKKNFYYMGDISFITEFSTEKANLWKGGNLKLYVLNDHGENPSADEIGALQNISGIEAPNQTHLYQLSYEQNFQNLSILLGLYTISDDFAYSRFALNYVNSSFGIQPDISLHAPVSTFPASSLGVRLKWEISPAFTFLTCINQGDGGDAETNPYGFDYSLKKGNGLYTMNELQYRYMQDSVEMTTIKLGTWFLHPNHDSEEINNHGLYCIVEQMLIPKGDDKGLGIFFQAGYVPSTTNIINSYYGGGLLYTGFSKKRSDDCFGISFANVNINKDYREIDETITAKNELFIEGMYRAKFGEHFCVQPSLQCCFNSGGIKEKPMYTIGICRLTFDF